MKNAEKDILTRTISTGVLTRKVFFFLCFCKFCIFAENTTKHRGFRPPPKKEKTQKTKMIVFLIKTGPSLCKNWSKYVAQHNWTNF